LEKNRFTPISGVPAGFVDSIVKGKLGYLWIANQDRGLFRVSPDGSVEQIPWSVLGHKDYALTLAADPLEGGIWLGFYNGGVVWFREGQVRASLSKADGLPESSVNDLRFDGDGVLWVATEGGLSRLKNGHATTLTSKNGLPCNAVHWTIEDDARS